MTVEAYICQRDCCDVNPHSRGFGGRPITVNGHHFETFQHVAAEFDLPYDTLQYRMHNKRCLRLPVRIKEGVERRTRRMPVRTTLFNEFLRVLARPGRVSSDAAAKGPVVSRG